MLACIVHLLFATIVARPKKCITIPLEDDRITYDAPGNLGYSTDAIVAKLDSLAVHVFGESYGNAIAGLLQSPYNRVITVGGDPVAYLGAEVADPMQEARDSIRAMLPKPDDSIGARAINIASEAVFGPSASSIRNAPFVGNYKKMIRTLKRLPRAQEPWIYIAMLLVHKSHRRRRYATILLSYATSLKSNVVSEASTSSGSRGAKLWLHVKADNADAIRLYKKFGFQIQGRLHEYYPDGDAFVMTRVT